MQGPDGTTGKASPGQRFVPPPAAIWNNMVDAGRAYANEQLSQPGQQRIRPRDTDLIKVLNDSGALRRTGEILKISGKALDTVTAEYMWLIGVATTADCRFGILKAPVADNGIEQLQVSGVCMALVDVSNTNHTRAVVVAGDYVLASAFDGPLEILYAPSGTGELLCCVRFSGDRDRRPAVIGSTLSAPASSLATATSCTIYFLELQSDGTQDLLPTSETAYNDDPEMTATVGTYCRVEKLNNRWMIYYLGCDAQTALEDAIDAL